MQELKSLLLEAQKGPESLQEALRVQAGNHRSQQQELGAIIDGLRLALKDPGALRDAVSPDQQSVAAQSPPHPQLIGPRTRSLLEALPPQMGELRHSLSSVQGQLSAVRTLLERRGEPPQAGGAQAGPETLLGCLQDSQRTLGEQLRTTTVCNALFSYTAATLTVCALYLLLRGSG